MKILAVHPGQATIRKGLRLSAVTDIAYAVNSANSLLQASRVASVSLARKSVSYPALAEAGPTFFELFGWNPPHLKYGITRARKQVIFGVSAAVKEALKIWNGRRQVNPTNSLGIITNSTLQPNAFPHRCFEVMGSNGLALLQPIEQPELELDLKEEAGPYQKGSQIIEFPEYNRYEGDFAELVRAIRGEGKLRVSLEEELLVQEAVLRASGMF